ncbi:UbiD family decarboxylase domain-containing protein, partial [Streptomyces sp. AC627_RSS907]
VFGTDRRLLKALGLTSYQEISEKIGGLLKPELPMGFTGVREAFGKLAGMTHVPPKKVKDAPVHEVVLTGDQVDLDRLPALFTWPGDGGSFFNLGLTHTKHPETGVRNLGLYRLQRHDKRTIGMHWQIHKDSTNHYQVAARRGERLPVAIAFGTPPAVTYASTAPLPGDIDEYLFAGFLRGKRIEMVDCKTVPLQVPAHSEVVLEG